MRGDQGPKYTRQANPSGGLVGPPSCSQVEGEAQGDEEAVRLFLQDIDKGPPHASVVKVETHARDLADGETEFEVRR